MLRFQVALAASLAIPSASAAIPVEVIAEVGEPLGGGGPVVVGLAGGGEVTPLGRVGFAAEIGTGAVYVVWNGSTQESTVLVERAIAFALADGTLLHPNAWGARIDASGDGWVPLQTESFGSYTDSQWGRVRLGQGVTHAIGEPFTPCPIPGGVWGSQGFMSTLHADGAFTYFDTGCDNGSVFLAGIGDGASLTAFAPRGTVVTGVESVPTVSRGFGPLGGVSGSVQYGVLDYACDPAELCPDYNFGMSNAFVHWNAGSVTPILRLDDVLPGDPEGLVVAQPSSHRVLGVNTGGDALLLVQRVDLDTFTTQRALVVTTPGGALRVVARDGDEAPGLAPLTMTLQGGFLFDDGSVALFTRLAEDGDAATREALVRVDPTGAATLLDRAGRDLGGGRRLGFSSFVANPAGDLLVNMQNFSFNGLIFYAHDASQGEVVGFVGEPVLDAGGTLLDLTDPVAGGVNATQGAWTTGVDGRGVFLGDDRRFVLRSGDALVRAQIGPTTGGGEAIADFAPCPTSADGPGPQCGTDAQVAVYPRVTASGGPVFAATFKLEFSPAVSAVEALVTDVLCDTEVAGDAVLSLDCAFLAPEPQLAQAGAQRSTPVFVTLGSEPVEVRLTASTWDESGPVGTSAPVTTTLQADLADLEVTAEVDPDREFAEDGCSGECTIVAVTVRNRGPAVQRAGFVLSAELPRGRGSVGIQGPCDGLDTGGCAAIAELEVDGSRAFRLVVREGEDGDPVIVRVHSDQDINPANDEAVVEIAKGCGCAAGTAPSGAVWAWIALLIARRRAR